MIKEIDIRNFKCFRLLRVEDARRVNVIVGDNGVGKTALLEAIFLALGGSPEIAIRFRQLRGLEGLFSGSPRQIEEALWGDLFHNMDANLPLSVTLGGSGPEARSLSISRERSGLLTPGDLLTATGESSQTSTQGAFASLVFEWKDHVGNVYEVKPTVEKGNIKIGSTNEDLPDFFFYASSQTGSSTENAARFSSLSKARRHREFVEMFIKEYDWIEDLTIEVSGGAPVIHASIKGITEKIPINAVSGAISRLVSILLSIASRPRSVVLMDEAENGVYHTHHKSYWRALLSYARTFDCQLFVSTHSEEWLEALAAVADQDLDDISLWRLERGTHGPIVRQFVGRQAVGALKVGEVR